MIAPNGGPDLEDLYQNAPCGYLLLQEDGTITRVNDTFIHWTGRQREDLIGTRMQALLPIGDRILFSAHCEPQLAMSGAIDEVAVEILGVGGQRHPALLTATRTPAAGNQRAEIRMIVFNARERRRYEKELLAARRRAEESETLRAEAEAGLQRLVQHDGLTGLLNRAGLVDHLEAEAVQGADATGVVAVLLVDLDHFRAVNDSLGHGAGDELLTLMAARLGDATRGTATIARLTADEFVVVDRVTDALAAESLAGRLLGAVEAPVVIDGLELVISASIGVAIATEAETVECVLRHADVARYRAQAQGRNVWVRHDPAIADMATDRLRLLGELRHATARKELRLHYQPRVDLRSGELDGVEALVRWQHPSRGLLPPVDFIDVAEESGLIRQLGAAVLDEAVAQAVAWRDEGAFGGTPLVMAVNMSTRQLCDNGLVAQVTEVLTRHGLDPAQLTLEITETALMDDSSQALASLAALKSLGIGISVDDFGTGYSSLTYLRRFPVDELKIDRSFTAGLPGSNDDRAIIASCITLAHAVGLHAVAEGVETEEQRVALIGLGCDLAQGYHYSPPLPPDELVAWHRARSGTAVLPVAV